MTAASYVERAQRMARFLEDQESSGGGDRKYARDRISRKYSIAARALYALRYLPPKEIAADLYDALCTAVEDAASRQIKVLENEIEEARRGRLGPHQDVVRKAEATLEEAIAILKGGAK